ncbi:MAG: hypothetical protein QM699_11905 [Amaricoccus sp.]|uniref:hypothetical protein n=1 Tax=Amaricoccus sp. TaxID=1872485 RepID=UPI0039E5592C
MWIVSEASTPRSRTWTTLAALADTVAGEAVPHPAILMVRLPKLANLKRSAA